MLGNIWSAVSSLLYRRQCMACGEDIDAAHHGICINCRYRIPLTKYWLEEDNPVKELFAGLVPVVHASSMFFFSEGSVWRTLIHRFKYGGRWAIARNMGAWYGAELRDSALYDDIDLVVPVPLHPLKRMRRGYNQSYYLAEGIAKALGVELCGNAIRRRRNNPSQARRRVSERWANVDRLFVVRRSDKLRGRHILVVDDVLTSGATLTSCISTIVEAVPDCRISVATLAVTRRILRE